METPQWPEFTLSLIERKVESPDVDTYVFSAREPVHFEAGQYTHMRLSDMPEGEKPVHEFSFASAPHDEEISFGIDNRSYSAYQQRLQAMNPGDTLILFKIKGHMAWPPEVQSVVMIAGAVGITPFRSMIRDTAHKKLPLSISVLHVSSGVYVYADELTPLVGEYKKSTRTDLIHEIELQVQENKNAQFFVAGSPGFTETVVDKLTSLGISNIQSDPFKGLLE